MKKIFLNISIFLTILFILSIALVTAGFARFEMNFNNNNFFYEERPTATEFYISKELANEFNDKFKSTKNEFVVCLTPRQVIKESDSGLKASYEIYSYEGEINEYGKDFSKIGYCEHGTIHSHPKGSCYFSLTDINSFKTRIRYGEYFSIVMCGENEFVYITRNDFLERKIKII